MSTNAALVNSLEYYMDDLVDCFEDFVRKSLLVISVALGTIILMVMYVLKVLAERAAIARNTSGVGGSANVHDFQCGGVTTSMSKATNEVDTQDPMQSKIDTTIESDTESTSDPDPYKKVDTITSNYMTNNSTCTSGQLASRPSFDEKVLREIGLSSCSKPCNTSKRTVVRNNSGSRIEVPCLPTCISRHHLSKPRPCSKYIAIRTSCCSMCCVDDDRR